MGDRPFKAGSGDQMFPKKLYYRLPKECQKWNEHIENNKMAKLEAPDIKGFEFWKI